MTRPQLCEAMEIPALATLCASPSGLLERLDVGTLNVICALGLPGAERIDFARYHDWLDDAARAVDFETRRHWYRFERCPANFRESPGYFCCCFLVQILQQDFEVRYNPARVRDPKFQDPKCIDPDFRDSRDLFIHGIIDGPGGTCCSMPVLYVAVGRRLGYPLKLVEAKGHLFFRWDDPGGLKFHVPEVFNMEGSAVGILSDPDDFYRTWPEPLTESDLASGRYLRSLTPEEELASFLGTRGECLADNGRLDEAIEAWTWASGLAPHDTQYQGRLRQLLGYREAERLNAMLECKEVQRRRLDETARLVEKAGSRPLAQHGDSCQCTTCLQRRMNEPPRHGISCQCVACKRSTNPPQAFGHPPGCFCPQCSNRLPMNGVSR
jgi:hypothetical protein